MPLYGRIGELFMNQDTKITKTRLTSPRAAAVAGILFSVLLITSLVLVRLSVPADPQDAGVWLSPNGKNVSLALNLLPFAGIAFLWFIGVVRDRLGDREDRLFATVFLGSGLLFLAMLFASAAVAGGVISLFGTAPSLLIASGLYAFGRVVTYEIMNVYALKMAGVFMISTCSLSLRTGIFPRWMAFLGLALALFLMLSVGFFYWAPLVFPLWVLLISVYILLANLRRSKGEPVATVL
jgi:MFS family permease